MKKMAPLGNVYQAGTLSGNPLAMSAGLAMLGILKEEGVYETLEEKTAYLVRGLDQAAKAARVPVVVNHVASFGCGFFSREPVDDFESALKSSTEAYAVFFQEMLKQGCTWRRLSSRHSSSGSLMERMTSTGPSKPQCKL